MSLNSKPIRSLKDLKSLQPGEVGQSHSGKYYVYDEKSQKAVEVFPTEDELKEEKHDGQALENLEPQSEEGILPVETEEGILDPEVQAEDETPEVSELPTDDTVEVAEEAEEVEIVEVDDAVTAEDIIEIIEKIEEKDALIKTALSLLDQVAQILKNL